MPRDILIFTDKEMKGKIGENVAEERDFHASQLGPLLSSISGRTVRIPCLKSSSE